MAAEPATPALEAEERPIICNDFPGLGGEQIAISLVTLFTTDVLEEEIKEEDVDELQKHTPTYDMIEDDFESTNRNSMNLMLPVQSVVWQLCDVVEPNAESESPALKRQKKPPDSCHDPELERRKKAPDKLE